jgi:hypothetical protein
MQRQALKLIQSVASTARVKAHLPQMTLDDLQLEDIAREADTVTLIGHSRPFSTAYGHFRLPSTGSRATGELSRMDEKVPVSLKAVSHDLDICSSSDLDKGTKQAQ